MLQFERTKDSKASLDLGLQSVIHERLLNFIKIHQNKFDIDIAISQIIISSEKSINIYFDQADPLYNKIPLNPHEYFRKIFKECNLLEYLDEKSYYYEASHENFYRKSREYILKDEYKNYVVANRAYKNK